MNHKKVSCTPAALQPFSVSPGEETIPYLGVWPLQQPIPGKQSPHSWTDARFRAALEPRGRGLAGCSGTTAAAWAASQGAGPAVFDPYITQLFRKDGISGSGSDQRYASVSQSHSMRHRCGICTSTCGRWGPTRGFARPGIAEPLALHFSGLQLYAYGENVRCFRCCPDCY